MEPDGYVLSRTSAERERLIKQARSWAEATDRALLKAGLGAGMRTLDVGCGPGEVMRAMAKVVGPSGSVSGIDIDAEIGEDAVRRLLSEGPSIFSFEQFDLGTSAVPRGAPFDLVFARLILFHMTDKQAALRRMWDWVAPGGSLLIMDYDLSPARAEPAHSTIDAGLDLMRAAFAGMGRDYEVGTRLPSLFVASGIGAPDGTDVSGILVDSAEGVAFVTAALRSLQAAIQTLELSSTEALASMLDELGQITPGEGFMRRPDMVATWKAKR